MAFCGKCGTQIQEGEKFCPSCGAPTQTQTQVNDIEANKVMAVIAYIGILVLVPLIMGKYKNSPFLKFHVNQALVFCLGYVLSMIIFFIPFIGAFLGGILNLGIIVMQIICIISVIKGQTKPFPLISKIKIIK